MDVLVTDPAAIRTFSRMIHCAAKIGEHVMLSPQPPSTLTLRVINPSQSTFAHFRCHSPFFAQTALSRASPSTKLHTRALHPIFRSAQSIVTLRIATTTDPVHVLFELKSRTNVIKRFRVPVIPGRIGLTAFDKRSASCTLRARPRLFLDVLAHFHVRLDEITLAPSQSTVRIASFVDDVANPANLMLRTEITLDAREFDVYTFVKSAPVPLTIFCKYLRSVLEFCDPLDLPVSVFYDAAGMPVLFELSAEGPGAETAFDVQFIFASRHADEDHAHRLSPHRGPHPMAASHTPSNTRNARPHTPLQPGRLPTAPQSSPPEPLPSVHADGASQPQPPHLSPQANPRERRSPRVQDSLERDHWTSARQVPTPVERGIATSPPKGAARSIYDRLPSPQLPVAVDSEDDEDEYVEGTPPPSPT